MNLEAFLTSLSWDNFDKRTQNKAKWCLLDTIGCALSGSQATGVEALDRRINNESPGEVAVWGTSYSTTMEQAVFLNAHAASIYDLDDGHRKAQGHPGGVIIPVAVTIAGKHGVPGKVLLEAVIMGYEIAVRSALIVRGMGGPRKGSGGWAATGAAAAAAHILKLDTATRINALGLAEYYAPQAPQDRSVAYPSPMKEGIPWAAHVGLSAANLAAAGLEGMHPFLSTSPFTHDIGDLYEINRVYFKKYACCRWAHPAIDGVRQIIMQTGKTIQEIDRIDINTFEKATSMSRYEPKSMTEAQYSIPFAVACALLFGGVSPENFTHQGISDKTVLALASKVHLSADIRLSHAFPEKCLQQITICFIDGAAFDSGIVSAKGDPDNPFSDSEMLKKFESLSKPIIGERWESIAETVFNLESLSSATLAEMLKTRQPRC